MPELPEVETIRRELLPWVKGRKIVDLKIEDSRSIKGVSPKKFKKEIIGKKILALERRAKYLLFKLSSGKYLVIHLGLTGRLLISSDPYVKVIFHLSGKRNIFFSDARLFGKIKLYSHYPELKLGPEPLTEAFLLDFFQQILQKKKVAIKVLLMDQKIFSGVGNIYANEALFRAGIHPQRPANSLKTEEIKKLHREIEEVLLEAIKYRGTSDNWYVDAKGEKGKYQLKLKVYGREKKTCYHCQHPLQRITLGGRGTFFCPHCQPFK